MIFLRSNKEAWSFYQSINGPEKRGTFNRGYFIGAVNAIYDRLEEMQKQQAANVTALVLTNEVAIREKKEELFSGNLRDGKAKKSSSNHGASLGYRDGKNVNINGGLNESKKQENEKIR